MEQWRSVPGYEGLYEVSSEGRVRNAKGYVMSPGTNERGYKRLALWRRGAGSKEFKVHRLVAMAFLPNPDDLPEVNHKDLDKANNALSNLEWVDHIGNHVHCLQSGKYDAVQFEERRRKLTPENVVEMRAMRVAGASLRLCGERFGICTSTASKIVRGESWPTLGGASEGVKFTNTDHVTDEQRDYIVSLMPAAASDLAERSGLAKLVTYAVLRELVAAGRATKSRVKTQIVYRPRSLRLVGTSTAHGAVSATGTADSE